MTFADAIRRFEREAARLDREGLHAPAHDYRKYASELRRLERLASTLGGRR